MAKRIWMNTEKVKTPSYFSIRWGLGEFDEAAAKIEGDRYGYCPKIFTTRTHPLSGEYYVVEGSRIKAKPVEPRIEFKAEVIGELILSGCLRPERLSVDEWRDFPKLDLGIKNATWDDLKNALLRLNPKATLDTPFYVNRLERIEE